MLQLHVLIDGLRGRRGGKIPVSDATSNEKSVSSLQMLQPLVAEFTGRVRVSLYHTPEMSGLWQKIIPDKYHDKGLKLLLTGRLDLIYV